MKGRLVVGGAEIALSVRPGSLEQIACQRYAWYLRPVDQARCRLSLQPMPEHREPSFGASVNVGAGEIRLDHPWFEGRIRSDGQGSAQVLPEPASLDALLEAVLATLAPRHGTIVADAAGIISRGHGHLLLGPRAGEAVERAIADRRPIIGSACVSIECRGGDWWLSGAPFGIDSSRPARSAPLRAVWLVEPTPTGASEPIGGAACAGLVVEHAVLPAHDPALLDAALDLATDLARAVPAARLPPEETRHWDRIDELATALRLRRALSTPQPEMRARLLRGALPGSTAASMGRSGEATSTVGRQRRGREPGTDTRR